jgi:succinoglycan biosynthesis transport protein ExoP
VVSIDQEIAHLNELLAGEKATQIGSVTSQLNPNRIAVEQQLHQATIRLEGLRATKSQQDIEIARLNSELLNIDQAAVRLSDIERKRSLAEQDYLTVAKRKFDADISSELDRDRVSNVSIAALPSASLEPAYPRKLVIMAISLAAGLIFGISLALLLNYLNDRTISPEQVELATGMPCLGVLDAGTLP